MNKVKRYSSGPRERAVRRVFERERQYGSQWATIHSISEKGGCTRGAVPDGGRCFLS